MANKNLTNAKRAKNDEFYTQYSDIQKESEAHLEYSPNVFRGKVVFAHFSLNDINSFHQGPSFQS